MFSMRHRGIAGKQALAEALASLPGNHLNSEFRELIASMPMQPIT
jgi:hypothetical protein